MVTAVLASHSIKLLVDEGVTVDVEGYGKVEILGFDFVFPFSQKEHVHKVVGTSLKPIAESRARIFLLHDPGAFRYVPPDCNALVLSGHTHGGHVGFFFLGKPFRHWTIVRMIGHFDNGAWTKGTNVLYAHRGQGSRSLMANMVLRMGVPPEFSILHLKND
jgi:predicted MPP superfamily phosphohydrolase